MKSGSALHPLVSALEVALRNAIHTCATQKIGPDWYDTLHSRTRKSWKLKKSDTRNIAYHKKEISKVKGKIKNKQAPKGLNKHDLLVAKLDFGVWDNLLRACFSVNGNFKALWPQCTPLVFPNLPKGLTNEDVQLRVSQIRELRNDISHNSPPWKHKSVSCATDAVSRINDLISEILTIIGWLSSDKVDWLQVHMLESEARRVASSKYLLFLQRDNVDYQKLSQFKRSMNSKVKLLAAEDFSMLRCSKNQIYMVTKSTLAPEIDY